MTRLALCGNQRVRLCDIELDRAGPSYTVDTLAQLVNQYPKATFSLLLGVDAANSLHEWYHWEKILDYARLVIVERPGFVFRNKYLKGHPNCYFLQPKMGLWLSSSVIRAHLAAGYSVRYVVPEKVILYAQQKGLYGYDKKSFI